MMRRLYFSLACSVVWSVGAQGAWSDKTADWMGALGDCAPLAQIMMPASHDSGMSEGAACNNGLIAKDFFCTHDRNVLAQMEAGARFFDLRPDWRGNELRACHHARSGGSDIGGDGEKFSAMFDGARAFLRAHPTETVIFKVSHWHFDGDADEKAANQTRVIALAKDYGDILLTWPDPSWPILNQLPLMSARGKLILVLDGVSPDPANGLWGYSERASALRGHLNVYDSYANRNDLAAMREDQVAKWKANAGSPATRAFLLAWTLTMQVDISQVDSLSIRKMAEEANPALTGALAANVPHHGKPTFVSLDYLNAELCKTIVAYNEDLLAANLAARFGDDLPDDATPAEVADVLKTASDGNLRQNVRTVSDYRQFCQWATAHQIPWSRVNGSSHAWTSYLLDCDGLLARALTDDDLTAVRQPTDDASVYDLIVTVRGVTIGEGATEERLRKAFLLQGRSSRADDVFSSANVIMRSLGVSDGKLHIVGERREKSADGFEARMRVW